VYPTADVVADFTSWVPWGSAAIAQFPPSLPPEDEPLEDPLDDPLEDPLELPDDDPLELPLDVSDPAPLSCGPLGLEPLLLPQPVNADVTHAHASAAQVKKRVCFDMGEPCTPN
jgi:hypothetical protein